MAENEKTTTVKSVFKSGERTTTEGDFTDKWIELINTLEKVQSIPCLTEAFKEMEN